jgi:hypothetical protein
MLDPRSVEARRLSDAGMGGRPDATSHLEGRDAPRCGTKRTPQDRERLSLAMCGYWTSFARDGVPSCADVAAWPA